MVLMNKEPSSGSRAYVAAKKLSKLIKDVFKTDVPRKWAVQMCAVMIANGYRHTHLERLVALCEEEREEQEKVVYLKYPIGTSDQIDVLGVELVRMLNHSGLEGGPLLAARFIITSIIMGDVYFLEEGMVFLSRLMPNSRRA